MFPGTSPLADSHSALARPRACSVMPGSGSSEAMELRDARRPGWPRSSEHPGHGATVLPLEVTVTVLVSSTRFRREKWLRMVPSTKRRAYQAKGTRKSSETTWFCTIRPECATIQKNSVSQDFERCEVPERRTASAGTKGRTRPHGASAVLFVQIRSLSAARRPLLLTTPNSWPRGKRHEAPELLPSPQETLDGGCSAGRCRVRGHAAWCRSGWCWRALGSGPARFISCEQRSVGLVSEFEGPFPVGHRGRIAPTE